MACCAEQGKTLRTDERIQSAEGGHPTGVSGGKENKERKGSAKFWRAAWPVEVRPFPQYAAEAHLFH